MLEYKQSFLIGLFSLITLGLLGLAYLPEWGGASPLDEAQRGPQTRDESFFKGVNFYLLESEKPTLFLDASDLTLHTYRNEMSFFHPKGTAYTEEGRPVVYEAMRGHLNSSKQVLSLFESVHLKMEEDSMKAQRMVYRVNDDYLDAQENVQSYLYDEINRDSIYVDAKRAFGRPRAGLMEYEGEVRGRIVRLRAYEPPVHFEADRMKLSMPDLKINLIDKVRLRKQGLAAESHNGEIFLDNYNKKLKYYVLNDDVKVVEKVQLGRDSFERRSFSERLEGFATESRIVLTGYPRVFQHQDTIKGNRITLRENTEVIEVEDSNTHFRVGN